MSRVGAVWQFLHGCDFVSAAQAHVDYSFRTEMRCSSEVLLLHHCRCINESTGRSSNVLWSCGESALDSLWSNMAPIFKRVFSFLSVLPLNLPLEYSG